MSTPPTEPIWRPEVVPGEHVFLSHLRREDIPPMTRWFSDLEITAYIGALGTSFTLEQEHEWFEQAARSGDKNFAIVLREGRRLIGSIGLKQIDYRHGTAELGITIGEKDVWGQGYGSEAMRLLVDYGFTFLALHSIHLWYAGFNERGRRAYLKAGFRPAGRLRGAILIDGQRYDKELMDITRAEFGPSRLRGLVGLLDAAR